MSGPKVSGPGDEEYGIDTEGDRRALVVLTTPSPYASDRKFVQEVLHSIARRSILAEDRTPEILAQRIVDRAMQLVVEEDPKMIAWRLGELGVASLVYAAARSVDATEAEREEVLRVYGRGLKIG